MSPVMTTHLLRTQDGWAFRDGRPNQGSNGSRSLPIGHPSTFAGAARTLHGSNAEGVWVGDADEMMKMPVHGPILMREAAASWEPLFPSPCDAIWNEVDDAMRSKSILALAPLDVSPDIVTSLKEGLCLVGLTTKQANEAKGKPPKDAPAWWSWPDMEKWLKGQTPLAETVVNQGFKTPAADLRHGVGIGDAWVAKEGALFRVERRIFRQGESLGSQRELALSVRVESDLSNRTGRLGGKGQMTRWEIGQKWPDCPAAVLDGVITREMTVVRVILATGAIFKNGALPSRLLEEEQTGVKVKLIAAKVDRPQTISGWDYKTNKPKSTRRLAPAGSVYWLELSGSAEARKSWVASHWLQPVSDARQDCLDGFGLALIGLLHGGNR